MISSVGVSPQQQTSRRRWIVLLSVLGNLLLLTAAYQEYQRMQACKLASYNSAAAPIAVESEASAPTRRLLELSTSSLMNYPAALELQHSSAVAIAPAGRSLLAKSDAPRTLGTIYPAPEPSAALHIKDDLSDDATFDLASHEFTWKVCPLEADAYHDALYPFCEETAQNEQKWQMKWFGQHVVPGPPRPFPSYPGCTHLPPDGYKWPKKHPQLPAPGPAVHYPNLRIQKLEDLKQFNRGTPKNLYHFEAEKYDLDALSEVELAEKIIPFAKKIRLMLDVGAGGGSLGLLLKAKYDVQTLSTVFADWPYCEYITERGGNCILMDVMEAMPVAKFSFDAMHVSWVYHGQHPDELKVMFHELNRVLRPGGYLWLRGGWSQVQFDFLKMFLHQLGYVNLHSDEQPKPAQVTAKTFFGADHTLPYALDWTAIYVKPIKKERAADCPSDAALPQPKKVKRE